MQVAFERLTQLINPAGVQVPAFVVGPTAGIAGGRGQEEFRRVRAMFGDPSYTAAFQPGVCAKPGCTNATTDATATHFSFCPHHAADTLSPLTNRSAELLRDAPVAVRGTALEARRLCDGLSTDQLHDLLYQHIAPLAALKLASATDDAAKKFYGDVLFAVAIYKETFNPWCEAVAAICGFLGAALAVPVVGVGASIGLALVCIAIAVPLFLLLADKPGFREAAAFGFIGVAVGGALALGAVCAGAGVVAATVVVAALPPVGLAMALGSVCGIGIGLLWSR